MGYSYKDIKIIYEDNHILVVVKPANIPTQADSSGDLDMLTMMKEYLVEKYNKKGEAYLGMVHRLDRPVGGILVFAKSSKAALRLSESIKKNEFTRSYLAITHKSPKNLSGNLVHYLNKNSANNTVSIVPLATVGAKRAELFYKVLQTSIDPDTGKDLSLIKVDLETGRSHQIRVQLASLHTPLYGDFKYGKKENKYINNQNVDMALWASIVKFIHPTKKEKMTFILYPDVDQKPWSLFNVSSYLNIGMAEKTIIGDTSNFEE